VDVLNVRLARRYQYDHGADGLGETGAQPARQRRDAAGSDAPRPPHVGTVDDGWLQQLLDAIDAAWAEGRLKYDIRHFMANWAMMVAADKHSPMFRIFMCYTSDAIFKMLAWAKAPDPACGEPGMTEAERVRGHMVLLGMSDGAIRRASRRYWRRLARYSCPEPSIIVRGLFDVFTFFREMDDPLRPGHKFFVHDAEAIFLKEIAYVQKGYLSDIPRVNYYFCVRICSSTQFVYFRGKRSNSALEGYHLHLRAAQHPCAKGSMGPRLEMARTELFDFAWNVKAAIRANLMPDVSHFHLWLNDALFDICQGAFVGTDAPPALKDLVRLDTKLEPIT
jgi:hypothetical protein